MRHTLCQSNLFVPNNQNFKTNPLQTKVSTPTSLRDTATISIHKTNSATEKSVHLNTSAQNVRGNMHNTNTNITPKILLPTPIMVQQLNDLLNGYHNKDFIINGFTEGFRLKFEREDLPLDSKNSQSAINNPEAVNLKLKQEIDLGRIVGPFEKQPFPNFKSFPLAIKEKKNTGKYRLLHNLSYPYDDRSVNFNISHENSTVKYAKIHDAILQIQSCSPKAFLAKLDISDAFRIVPLHPSQYHLTGFYWHGYYYDRCLPMGCSSSCQIFEEVSNALKWILEYKLGVKNVIKILDDFLFINNSKQECQNYLNKFCWLCREVGVPLAPHKTVNPTNDLDFLGVGLNSIEMLAYIPQDKITDYTQLVTSTLNKSKVTLRELKSLLGKLQFSTCIITTGRAFLRRMYDLTKGIAKPFYFIRITKEVKEDLKIWEMFLKNFNGKTIIRELPVNDSLTLHMYSDASKLGFGATFGSEWIQSTWPENWKVLNIALLELFPIYVMINMFGMKLTNSKILFHCDNIAVVSIVNNQTSKDKLIMKLVRPLVLLLLQFNINFKAVHIAGVKNVLADAISRYQVDNKMLEMYGMQEKPLDIPETLKPTNFQLWS